MRSFDVRTLGDGWRIRGGGWLTTMRRVLCPKMAESLTSSAFQTATDVLGEFTIARSLAKNTFATFSFEYFGRSPQGGISLALLTLLATTALLGFLTLATRTKSRRVLNKSSRP